MTPNKFQHGGIEWIPHTPGDPMPCADDTRVRVLLRNLKQGKAEAWVGNWAQIPGAYGLEIIGWHPIEEQPSLSHRVLGLMEAGDIEQAKHELRKELE